MIRWSRVGVLLQKEWLDVWQRPGVKFTLLFPVMLLTLMAVLALYAGGMAGPSRTLPSHLPTLMQRASRREVMQYLALSPFLLLWLIFPVSVPTALAAYSIVGEKEEGTLEPLLATPIGTSELLLAKAIAAGLPGLLLLTIPFSATLLAGTLLDCPRVMAATLFSGAWLLTLLLVAPTLTFCSVMLVVLISSRAQDVRSANQMGSLLVLPLILLFVSQVSHGLVLDVRMVFICWIGLMVVGFGLMSLAVRLFQREAILVRWKQGR